MANLATLIMDAQRKSYSAGCPQTRMDYQSFVSRWSDYASNEAEAAAMYPQAKNELYEIDRRCQSEAASNSAKGLPKVTVPTDTTKVPSVPTIKAPPAPKPAETIPTEPTFQQKAGLGGDMGKTFLIIGAAAALAWFLTKKPAPKKKPAPRRRTTRRRTTARRRTTRRTPRRRVTTTYWR